MSEHNEQANRHQLPGRGIKWQRIEEVPCSEYEAQRRHNTRDALFGKAVTKRQDGVTHGQIVFCPTGSSYSQSSGLSSSISSSATIEGGGSFASPLNHGEKISTCTSLKVESTGSDSEDCIVIDNDETSSTLKKSEARKLVVSTTIPKHITTGSVSLKALAQIMLQYNGHKRGLDTMWKHMGVETNMGHCLYAEEVLFLMQTGDFRALCPKNRVLSVEHALAFTSTPYAMFRVYSKLCGAALKPVRHQPHVGITSCEKKIKLDQHNKFKKKKTNVHGLQPVSEQNVATSSSESFYSTGSPTASNAPNSSQTSKVASPDILSYAKDDLDSEMMAFYSCIENETKVEIDILEDDAPEAEDEMEDVVEEKEVIVVTDDMMNEYERSKQLILRDLPSMNPTTGECRIEADANFLPSCLKILKEDYVVLQEDIYQYSKKAMKANRDLNKVISNMENTTRRNHPEPTIRAEPIDCDSDSSEILDSDTETSSSSDSESVSSLSDSEDVCFQGWYTDWNNVIYMKRIMEAADTAAYDAAKRNLDEPDDRSDKSVKLARCGASPPRPHSPLSDAVSPRDQEHMQHPAREDTSPAQITSLNQGLPTSLPVAPFANVDSGTFIASDSHSSSTHDQPELPDAEVVGSANVDMVRDDLTLSETDSSSTSSSSGSFSSDSEDSSVEDETFEKEKESSVERDEPQDGQREEVGSVENTTDQTDDSEKATESNAENLSPKKVSWENPVGDFLDILGQTLQSNDFKNTAEEPPEKMLFSKEEAALETGINSLDCVQEKDSSALSSVIDLIQAVRKGTESKDVSLSNSAQYLKQEVETDVCVNEQFKNNHLSSSVNFGGVVDATDYVASRASTSYQNSFASPKKKSNYDNRLGSSVNTGAVVDGSNCVTSRAISSYQNSFTSPKQKSNYDNRLGSSVNTGAVVDGSKCVASPSYQNSFTSPKKNTTYVKSSVLEEDDDDDLRMSLTERSPSRGNVVTSPRRGCGLLQVTVTNIVRPCTKGSQKTASKGGTTRSVQSAPNGELRVNLGCASTFRGRKAKPCKKGNQCVVESRELTSDPALQERLGEQCHLSERRESEARDTWRPPNFGSSPVYKRGMSVPSNSMQEKTAHLGRNLPDLVVRSHNFNSGVSETTIASNYHGTRSPSKESFRGNISHVGFPNQNSTRGPGSPREKHRENRETNYSFCDTSLENHGFAERFGTVEGKDGRLRNDSRITSSENLKGSLSGSPRSSPSMTHSKEMKEESSSVHGQNLCLFPPPSFGNVLPDNQRCDDSRPFTSQNTNRFKGDHNEGPSLRQNQGQDSRRFDGDHNFVGHQMGSNTQGADTNSRQGSSEGQSLNPYSCRGRGQVNGMPHDSWMRPPNWGTGSGSGGSESVSWRNRESSFDNESGGGGSHYSGAETVDNSKWGENTHHRGRGDHFPIGRGGNDVHRGRGGNDVHSGRAGYDFHSGRRRGDFQRERGAFDFHRGRGGNYFFGRSEDCHSGRGGNDFHRGRGGECQRGDDNFQRERSDDFQWGRGGNDFQRGRGGHDFQQGRGQDFQQERRGHDLQQERRGHDLQQERRSHDFQRGRGQDFQQGRSDDFQRRQGDDFQRVQGCDDFQRGRGGDFLRVRGGDFQRGRSDDFQRGRGNDFQRGRGDDFQRGRGDDFQRDRGDDFQRGRGDDFQRGRGDDFQRGRGDDFQRGRGDDFQRGRGGVDFQRGRGGVDFQRGRGGVDFQRGRSDNFPREMGHNDCNRRGEDRYNRGGGPCNDSRGGSNNSSSNNNTARIEDGSGRPLDNGSGISRGNARQQARQGRWNYWQTFKAQKSMLDESIVHNVSSWHEYKSAVKAKEVNRQQRRASKAALLTGDTKPLVTPTDTHAPTLDAVLSSVRGAGSTSTSSCSGGGDLSDWLQREVPQAAALYTPSHLPQVAFDVYSCKSNYSRSNPKIPDFRVVLSGEETDENFSACRVLALRRHHADSADLALATNAESTGRVRHVAFPAPPSSDGRLRPHALTWSKKLYERR